MSILDKLAIRKKNDQEASNENVDLSTGEITKNEIHREVPGRTISDVDKNTSIQTKITQIMAGVFIVGICGLLLTKYYIDFFKKREEESQETQVDTKKTAKVGIPPLEKPSFAESVFGTAPAAPPLPPDMANSNQHENNVAGGSFAPTQNGKPVLTDDELAEARRLKAPVKFKISGSSGASAVSAQRVEEVNSRRDGLTDDLRPSYTPGVKASLIPDMNMFITKGTGMDCSLDAAITSALQGFFTCYLSDDVKSANGYIVLLEKMTKITGEFKGEIKGKDSRIFILASRAETPKGVVVNLDSPGTDSLGRAGIGGDVNTHFMERFSAGILTAVIGDVSASQTRGGSVAGSNNTVTYPGTTQGFANISSEMIKQNSTIPNTLERNQGAVIRIQLARDLDFRSVYRLEYDK